MSYPIIFQSDSATANSCRNERKYKNIMGTWIWYTVCLYVIFSQAPPLHVKSLFAISIWCHQNCLPLFFSFFFLPIIPPQSTKILCLNVFSVILESRMLVLLRPTTIVLPSTCNRGGVGTAVTDSFSNVNLIGRGICNVMQCSFKLTITV